jgi:hypothetical protein
VRDRHQVLHHFVLRTQRFSVHHEQLTAMTAAQMREEIKAKAHQSIFVGNDDHCRLVWGLNPRHWLSAFFDACAAHGGQTPTDLRAFLPWQMTEEGRRQTFMQNSR